MAGNELVLDFNIVVKGTTTVGAHINTYDSRGDTATAIVITVCNQGDTVQVINENQSTERYGSFNGINASAFSGTLLSLLSN